MPTPSTSNGWCAPLQAILGDRKLVMRDWRHQNDQLVGILQVQKDTMFIVLGMIILVAAFNVISSLIMLVKDKTPGHRGAAHDGRERGRR